jgi:hypothetical protein
MLQYLKEIKRLWDWNRSELGQLINVHNKTFMDMARFAGFSDNRKQTIIGELMSTIQSIVNAENQLVALRKEIVDAAFHEADLAVLALTESEKQAGFCSDVDAISGELYHHIVDCAAHQNGLKTVLPHIDPNEVARENMTMTDALRDVANTQSLIALYHLNGLHMVRPVFNDGPPNGRDWFRPMVVSAMIHLEDVYRGKIGMPSLLRERESFMHLAFGSLVLREKNPLLAWEAEFKVRHPCQP